MGDEVLSISLLGAFSVALGGEVIADDAWRLRKAKTLIKLLALAPERRMHSGEAAELLWPDRDQASARNNLHQAIFAARRALDSIGLDGAACLELHDDLIELCSEAPVWIDVEAFEEAGARARAGRDASAYRAALDSHEGELLPEDRYEEWTATRRDAVHELRLALGIELAGLEAEVDPAAAIDRLRAVLVDEPLHEPAHRALMRLYVDGGRRQEALARFQQLKLGLRREFEDEPDDETRRLYREILTRSHDEEPDLVPSPDEASSGGGRAPELPQQLTSFIGRDRELAEAATLLRNSRLLTLTGAGGCGKTRLALELAGQHRGDFADGVWPV
jgi:DNA-binding SARP family transcriptional activator